MNNSDQQIDGMVSEIHYLQKKVEEQAKEIERLKGGIRYEAGFIDGFNSNREKTIEKDYNEYSLLWQCYRFMIDTCQIKGWELEQFVQNFGLDSKEALCVAKKEEIEILTNH
jgi:hypothetical protein